MPYKHLPLNYIRTLKKYFPTFRSLGEANSNLVLFFENTKTEEWSFEYIDREIDHGFKFKLDAFEYRRSDSTVFCTVEFIPTDPQSVTATQVKTSLNHVATLFNSWLVLVKEYNELELTTEDKIRDYYEELYTANFEILDDDADTTPFDLERQLLIERFAILCIDTLQREPELNRDLIQYAIEIRDTVQSCTKKEILIKVSLFFAKVAQKSLPLLKELATEAKKTIFKKAIEFGFKEIHDLLKPVFNLLN